MKMHFFLKKNKKGFKWTLNEVIILAFAGFILVGMILFFFKLQSVVLSQPDDGSIANFDRLYTQVKELVESSDTQDYRVINYFIGKERILVGFSSDWDESKEPSVNDDAPKYSGKNIIMLYRDIPIKFDKLYKPFTCGTSACLCLYREKIPTAPNKKNDGLLKCRSDGISDKTIDFFNEHSNEDEDYFVIPEKLFTETYDGFTILYYFRFGGSSKVNPLYIEKTFDELTSTNNIYMSEIDTTDDQNVANLRKIDIDESRQLVINP